MSSTPALLRGNIVLPQEIIADGIVAFTDGMLTYVGNIPDIPAELVPDGGLPPTTSDYLLPGLVDIHNHGGGGASFPDATDAETVRIGANEHLKLGTTTLIASMVTASREVLLQRAALLASVADEGVIAGIHSEGPFVSHQFRGAQSPDYLIDGDPDFVRELAAAANGHLRTMTVAPEIPGVAGPGGAAEALIDCGVIPSLGHTGSTVEQAEALIQQVTQALQGSGKRMTVTHLFNGMPPMHHRSPGPIPACIAAAARGELVVELVADGIHNNPGTTRNIQSIVQPENLAFVTDAMAAAGMADGQYTLGPMDVVVKDGVARLADPLNPQGGAIAGGTAHLIDEVRLAVQNGIRLIDAVRSASLTPATALGFKDVGELARGKRADILICDQDLAVKAVYKSGAQVPC